MKKTILLSLTLLLSYSAISQRQTNGQRPGKINLSGKVIDQETQQPLEYATVTLRNDNRPELLQGGISTEDGSFSFEVFQGRYTIIIEYISFEKDIREGVVLREATDLGTVELSIATNSLDEVELVGERTEVEIRLDKRVYNVGKDITVRGGSVSDVMDNIPSVSVDVDGTISLRGNDNVRILINGKPSGLVGLSGPDALRQLPAESIEKVEVITSPSARYEASGTAGILNIILKKQELEGFNGSFIANGGFPKTYGGSASLNWRTKKLNIFTTTSLRDSRSNSNGLAETDFTIPSDTIFSSKEKTTNERDNQNVFVNLGAEYYFDDNTSLVLSGFIRKSESTSDNFARTENFFENKSLFNTIQRNQLQTGEDNSRQFTANFDKKFNDKGHELIIEFQTENSDELEEGLVANSSVRNQRSTSDENQKRSLFQLDYILPIDDNTQFELGYRGNFSRQETDYRVEDLIDNVYVNNTSFTNYLVFEQNVNAAYTQFGKKINNFSYLAGLRVEKTNITIEQQTTQETSNKNYTDWFPTLNLSYEFNEKENITLGYSRRIRRPRSYLINPFRSISSLTFFFQGNVDIDPSYTNSIDFGYLKRWDNFTFNGSVYFQKSTQNFSRITEATDEYVNLESGEYFSDPSLTNSPTVQVLQSTFINLAENRRTGTEFTLTYSPKRDVRISGNFNVFNSETIGDYNGDSLDASIVSWFARINASFPLPFDITTQIRGFYRGPTENAITKTEGRFTLTGALNKNILNKKATISFRASDILNSSRSISRTTRNNFTSYNEYQWRNPTYILTLTYRINERKLDRKRRRSNNESGGDGGDYEF